MSLTGCSLAFVMQQSDGGDDGDGDGGDGGTCRLDHEVLEKSRFFIYRQTNRSTNCAAIITNTSNRRGVADQVSADTRQSQQKPWLVYIT